MRNNQEESDAAPAVNSITSSPSDTSSSPSFSSVLTPATPVVTPTVHRMLYVNRAFERLTGFTQSQLHSFGLNGLSPFDLSMRKDHYLALNQIQQRWWKECAFEGAMYQVRTRADGRWMYCMIVWKVVIEKGRMSQVVSNMIPLPENDPEHPMPPFLDGVDLDVETLLYGYKPKATN